MDDEIKMLVTSTSNEGEPNICIVACGYRSIYSPKTGLSFPAWLVKFPNKNDCEASFYPCFRWRSKRDFLLLSRACASANSNLDRIPRASFAKLCQKVPWARPMGTAKETQEVDRFLGDQSSSRANSYERTMKKNVFLMDQFLQRIRQKILLIQGDNDTVGSSNNNTKGNDDVLLRAWLEFCRGEDTEFLEEDNEVDADAAHEAVSDERRIGEEYNHDEIPKLSKGSIRTSVQDSARLGQYFCTEENAEQVSRVKFFSFWMSDTF